MPDVYRWTLVSCGAAAAVALSGCANISGGKSAAPAPVKTVPSAVAALVKTDVGEYLVKPRPGTSSKDIQATLDQLKNMPGVQSAVLNKDGKIDVQFYGNSSSDQRAAAVKQLAALGDVEEGI